MNKLSLTAVLATALALAGCATGPTSPYADLPPSKAVAAIVIKNDSGATINPVPSGTFTSVWMQSTAIKETLQDLGNYCLGRNGYLLRWIDAHGISCKKKNGPYDFAVGLLEVVGTETLFTLAERTTESNSDFEKSLTLIGYKMSEQVTRERRERIQKAAEESRKREEQELALRKQNRAAIAVPGTKVCKRIQHMNSPVILSGTVEQVFGDRVKVFVERAALVNAPSVRPGNFQQHYTTENYWEFYPCD